MKRPQKFHLQKMRNDLIRNVQIKKVMHYDIIKNINSILKEIKELNAIIDEYKTTAMDIRKKITDMENQIDITNILLENKDLQ